MEQITVHEAIDRDMDLAWTLSHFGKEAHIYGEGDPSENVYQVLTGAIRSCKLLSDGRCQITAFHFPGDILDFDVKDFHTTSAEAIVKTIVRTINRNRLQQAALVNPALGSELWILIGNKLRHVETHLLLLGRQTALERVVAFLVEMDERLKGDGTLPLPMRRRDIADYLGLTLETVSRVLSSLHEDGIIGFAGDARQILLRDRNRFRHNLQRSD